MTEQNKPMHGDKKQNQGQQDKQQQGASAQHNKPGSEAQKSSEQRTKQAGSGPAKK